MTEPIVQYSIVYALTWTWIQITLMFIDMRAHGLKVRKTHWIFSAIVSNVISIMHIVLIFCRGVCSKIGGGKITLNCRSDWERERRLPQQWSFQKRDGKTKASERKFASFPPSNPFNYHPNIVCCVKNMTSYIDDRTDSIIFTFTWIEGDYAAQAYTSFTATITW